MTKRKKRTEKEVEVNTDVSVEDATEAAVDAVDAKLPGTWEDAETRVKAALAAIDVSADVSQSKITVYGATMAQAKDGAAVVWRLLGQALRDKAISKYPEVSTVVGAKPE